MDILQVLENAILSQDPALRTNAEAQLRDAATNHFVDYVSLLVNALANEEAQTQVRMLAGLALKNEFTAKDLVTKKSMQERWRALDDAAKFNIKEASLKALMSKDESAGRSAAQLVAAIADIELPLNQWPDLIPFIIENTKIEQETHVKKVALLTIGYICETLNPNDANVLAQANGILIAIVQGAQAEEKNLDVRLTALNALVNSLEFIKYNFDKEGERNYIMQVVCEATQADSSDLQEAAFGCLAKIMSLYYRYMQVYMEKALYGLTVSGMRSPNERVACMAIEFWSSVCEEELDYSMQKSEFGEDGLNLVSYNFALIALNEVYPTLLTLLTRQNEDPEDDDWSVAMAAGACVQLFAQNTGNYIIESTLNFVDSNIGSENWREREAAMMAFGSVLDGPDVEQLQVPIMNALPSILALTKDENLQVRETTAWSLGRLAEIAIAAIEADQGLPSILEALLNGLKDHPRVATNCCWAFMNLVEQLCTDGPDATSTPLSPYVTHFIPMLIQLTNKTDNESSSRDAAFEALSVFVQNSGQDTIPIVQNIAQEILGRLEQTIGQQQQPLSTESRVELEELQISTLSLLTTIIRRLNNDVLQASDNLMEMFLKLLGTLEPNALIEEDILIAISAVASAVGPNFSKYMESFLPFLTKALQNTESPTAATAVGIVADLCHSLGPAVLPYLEVLMNILGTNLGNNQVRRNLKPAILSCFGHIATAIGSNFQPYVEFVFQICRIATLVDADDNSEETLEYLFNVREAVLECYAGIVGGSSEYPQILYPFIGEIFTLLHDITFDVDMISIESVAASFVGLLGDIASMYPGEDFKQVYQQHWVTEMIKRTRANSAFSETTRSTARWARDQQKRKLQ
ncbi:karyopherin Kap95 [Yamadazyma tenuis]|uniref:Importin-95 n=1 Tax=Candida tenuis (strain ATCC 10573 / BCRC 21748 / CBS 615 / JCM 9827 / NBRC 10315 / NRRL Y-1498 / VKM Y-70) TaxID=590646 RepID=G3BD05_CANTC|nr:uncharacterized protein CANTEDRAFT_128617 [Yamadazyma tenuis ATCC 10573]EGV60888.1 hypothetical protein CANTEDRAFT_128617 [Yamadazyma tenuis ATCC 10573]WEJ93842.1 karyopherin Kap95 [Yamadazyma tenuis]